MIARIPSLLTLAALSACTVTATPAPSRPYEPPPRTVVREPRHEPPPPEPMPPPPPRNDPPPPPPPRHEPPREDNVDWASRGWIMLGEHTVDGRIDQDQFDFSQKRGVISKIMLVVLDSDLEVLDFKIVSTNGNIYNPPGQHIFREGSRSRPIDLPKAEILRAVKLKYKNLPGGGRARVQVWAK